MTARDSGIVYRFGDFLLDTSRGVLLENGIEIELRPQSVMVLQILLENYGRLVGKDELNDRIWGRKAVTDDSLTQCLVDIRKVLHDTDRKLVRTIPRRGYRFDGEVAVESPATESVGRKTVSSNWRGLAAISIFFIAVFSASFYWFNADRQPSIAVLRFDDMSASQDLQFIGDGLAEDILNSLAHHQGIDVIARTSSFAYSANSQDIATIANALDVDYVLEGSVREIDDGVFRVVSQLIETGGSSHEWSETFDVSIVDLASVHQTISREVWSRIAPSPDAAAMQVSVPGFTADELMLLARDYESQLRENTEIDAELLTNALRWYRSAAAANPQSAKIQAGLARVLLISGDAEAAKRAVDSAVNLDENLSEVQDVLARYLWATGEAGAGSAWTRAVQLNPNNADAIGSLAYWTWAQGRMAEAEPLLRKALELDLNSLSRYADLGNFLGNEARVDEVHEFVELIQQRFDSAESYRVIARLLELVGDTDQSIAWLARARVSAPNNPVYRWALAELFIDIGDYETAQRLDPQPAPGLLLKMGMYPEFIEAAEDRLFEEPGNVVLRYLLAFAYVTVDKPELALWQLERARLLDFVFPEVRQMWDLEAFSTWADAMDALGRNDESRERLEQLTFGRPHTQSINWWRQFMDACLFSLLDNEAAAIESFAKITESPRLPFLYLMRDARCVGKFRDDPRYQSVIDDIENRQRDLRIRLPATLQRFDVQIPEFQAIE